MQRTVVIVAIGLALAAAGPRSAPVHALTATDIDAASIRATRHVGPFIKLLAGDRLHGRDNNTAESVLAQRFLVGFLKRLGAGANATQSGDDAYRQPFTLSGQVGTNLLAVIPGRERPDEYVVVGAHYDHLGTRSRADGSCSAFGTPGGRTCNGATDNAAGVAATLAIGEALRGLPTPPRRSVVLALWDSEEDGLVGSRYYVTHPVVPLNKTVAYVNFDILGQDLLPSLRNASFAVGSETGGTMLQDLVDSTSAAEGLDVHKVSYIFGEERSDYKNFVDKHVPTVFFSDSTGPCYHTTGDDLRIVNFAKLRAQSKIAFRVTVALAESETAPTFVPRNPQGANYTDAVSLNEVYSLAQADLALFGAADQATLQAAGQRVQRIVNEGAAQFGSDDAFTLLGDAIQAIDILTRSGCKK